MTNADQAIEITRPPQEKKHVPRIRQLARANVLALYWNQPLSSLMTEEQALPGIQERFLPEDRSQTLGVFLSEGDPQLLTFDEFKQQLGSNDRDKIRKVLEGFKTLCPSPEELFAQNPNLLNWVPWETFIAYGDVLQTQKRGADDEIVASVISGDTYLEEVKERFPKGFPNKRTEIVLERQNKDPKSQGILEAVSNAIDAISEREKIGQFGLGVKQVFAWLEKGKGEVHVMTKTAEGEILSLKARKGYDDQVYIKFSPPTEEEARHFSERQTGTVLKISDISIEAQKQTDINKKLHDQFQYVPETTIAVNGQAINGHEKIKIVGRTTPIVPKGQIDIQVTDNEIVIADSGSGMDQQTLFKMFLPGYGKGYKPLSAQEARDLAERQAEVLLVQSDTPKIVFSRNREADFSIDVPKDRLNTASTTICIELGRVLKVSEGRDGFEIDDNFAIAVPILVEKTLRDTTLTDTEKIMFLNSLMLGIDQLSGSEQHDNADKIADIARRIKKSIRTTTLPYLQQLRKNNTVLLPNFSVYEKCKTDNMQFLDPYLLGGLGEMATVLQSEGFKWLKKEGGIITKDRWKVFTSTLAQTEQSQQLLLQMQNEGKLIQIREQLTDLLPVVIDKENKIVIIDQTIWQKIDAEQDPVRKAYLQEAIQAIINDKVLTSYEASDPRVIFVEDKQETIQTEGTDKTELTTDEFAAFKSLRKIWSNGNNLYSLDESGIMKIYDGRTRELTNSIFINELTKGDMGENLNVIQPTDNGVWVLQERRMGDKLILIDTQGNIIENITFSLPNLTRYDYGRNVIISPDGKLVIKMRDSIEILDPRTQETKSYYFGDSPIRLDDEEADDEPQQPCITSTGEIYFIQSRRICKFDPQTEILTTSDVHEELSENLYYFQVLNYEGKQYAFISFMGIEETNVFELTSHQGEIVPRFLTQYKFLGKPQSISINNSQIEVMTRDNVYNRGDPVNMSLAIISFPPINPPDKTLTFSDDPMEQEPAYVLRTLKEFFGDDESVSYTDGILRLSSYLHGDQLYPLTSKITPFERAKQLVALLQSEPWKQSFISAWDILKDTEQIEVNERIKMRYVKNVALLLDFNGQAPTPELMQLLFLSDNPQVFFDQSEAQQQRFISLINSLDYTYPKEYLTQLATLLTKEKSPTEIDLFYGQLEKLFSKEQFRDGFLRTIAQNLETLEEAAAAPQQLDASNPLRSYLLFLTNQAELIRSKEEQVSLDGYEDILPQSIPLELLAYFRLTDALFTIDEINERIAAGGGVEAILEKINLYSQQDKIRQVIHAQAVEPGVSKRELLQNALASIRKKGKGDTPPDGAGEISVDFYLRSNGAEFVEKIKDTGTGIENLISFLVPGVTTKEATAGLGIFGTGFYKTLEDVDHIEVDSIKKGETHNHAERIIIDLIKDAEGRVQGGIIREIKAKTVSSLTETGATIKLIRKTEDHLPELEAMIAKNTYLTMGGLATVPQISGLDVTFSFVNEEGDAQPITIPITDTSILPLKDIGSITFVKVPSLPSAMTSLGLRISPLANGSSDYLRDVPEVLKTFFRDEHISVVLSKEIPLIIDRSKISGEEKYITAIQQAIGTETVKRAAYSLLGETTSNMRGLMPQDILTNLDYYRTLVTESGRQIYTISQKISANQVLNDEDLAILNTSDKNALLLTLFCTEQTDTDGKKDSLLRRFIYIQEKIGNGAISNYLATFFDIDPTQTALSPKLLQEEQRLLAQARQITNAKEKTHELEKELDAGRKPEGVTSLGETTFDEREKQTLTQYFANLGFDQVYFAPREQLGASGMFTGKRLLLNTNLLGLPPRKRLEVIFHEVSHLFEQRAVGATEASFDSGTEDDPFTHQQQGSFAKYYKIAANIMQTQLVK